MPRNAGSLTSGEIDSVRFVGPIEPATNRGWSGVRAVHSSRRRLREPRPLDVQLVDERLEAVVRLRDRGAGERVRLDDVGAGGEVLAVDAADDVGPRQDEEVAVAPQILGVILRTARRGSPPRSACSAGSSCPSRRRGSGCGAPAAGAARRTRDWERERGNGAEFVMSLYSRVAAGRVPLAISTVNGSPVRRAPTVTLTSVKPAAFEQPRQFAVGEARPAIAEPLAHPVLIVLAQIEHQHAAAGDQDPERPRRPPAPGRLGVMQRLRQQRDVHRRVADRQPARSRRGASDVGDAAPARQLARAFEHRLRPIDRDDARRPAAGLDGQVAVAAAEIGDAQAAAAGARARGPTPPSCGPARAAARGRRCRRAARSSPCGAAHFLEPRVVRAALRRWPRRCRNGSGAAARAGRSRCSPPAAPGRGGSRCRPPSRCSATRPASFSMPRWRDTPDCARPRMPVSSLTFRRSAASSRRIRSRASSPSSRKSAHPTPYL